MQTPHWIPGAEPDGGEWRQTSAPGVRWRLLWPLPGDRAPGTGTAREASVLIRMDPGHGYPAHRHVDVEEVLILEGGYRDGPVEHRAGTYLRYEAGSVHAPVALGDPERPAGPDNPACVLFASARSGIELLAEEPRP